MPGSSNPAALARHLGAASKAYEILTAVSMTIGRRPAARTVADTAGLTAGDQVIDIGCGPGTAVREAARRGVTATGADPSLVMLRLARWISALRRIGGVTWLRGRAETLPLPYHSATLVWALSSVHHWGDRAAAFGGIRRVLAPSGRVLLAERVTRPGARGHAAHGPTHTQAEDLARELTAAGFTGVQVQTRQARRRTLVILRGKLHSPS